MTGKRPSDAMLAGMITFLVFAFSITRQFMSDRLGSYLGTLAAALVLFVVAWACVRYVRRPT